MRTAVERRRVACLTHEHSERLPCLGIAQGQRDRVAHVSFELRFRCRCCVTNSEFLHFHDVAPFGDGAIFAEAPAR